MSIRNKWLLLPPAAALLLFLGPLRVDPAAPATAAPAITATPAETPGIAVPRTPDLWQFGSTLIGVILLGAAGIFVYARSRTGARTGGPKVVAVRQALRLSPKHHLFAVEYDERLLLLGASDGRITLLHDGRLPERAADEALVAARVDEVLADDDEDGAVPKDLVIPRPERPAAARRPTPPRSVVEAALAAAMQNLSKGEAGDGAARTGLDSFRSLLQKAGRQ